jgi:hypothetical protein
MPLSAGFRCTVPLPSDLALWLLSQNAQVDGAGDSIQIWIEDDLRWKKIFGVLAEHGVSRLSPISIGEPVDFRWQKPKDEWIGAVLGCGDDWQAGANPSEDYARVYPPHPGGYLPLDRPIHLQREPSDQLAGVGENEVFSARLVHALGGETASRFGGPVIFEGKELTSWRRFEPLSRGDVLDPVCVLPAIPCAACGSSLTPTLGIWVGRSDQQYDGPVVRDNLGEGHFASEHPLVVSLAQAADLQRTFRGKGYTGKGFTLDPIYSRHGKTSDLIQQVVEAAEQLEFRASPH